MSCKINEVVEELKKSGVAPGLTDKQLIELVSSKILSIRVENIIDDADIDKTKTTVAPKVNKPVAKLGTPGTPGALQAATLIKELVISGKVTVNAADGVKSNFSSKSNTINITDKDATDNETLAKLLLYKAMAGMTYDTLSDKTKETLGKVKEFILSNEYTKYDKYTLESLKELDRKDAELAYLRIMAKKEDAKFTREVIAVLGSSSAARSDIYSKLKSKKTIMEAFIDIIDKLKVMGEFIKSLLTGTDAKLLNNKEYLNFVEAVNEVMNQEPALVGDKAVLDMLSKVDSSKIVPYKSGTNALYTMRSRYNIVKSFGNPFMTAEGGVETQVDKKVGNNDEVSVMYYNWLKSNTIPSNYKGDLKLLNDRRTYILSNLDKVRDAKELAYSGTAKDNDVNHVKALLAIANDKTQPSTGYTVTPKANVPDAEKIKSVFKASKATKYIGFGQDGSSTKLYGEQLAKQGMPVNVGKYTKNDIVFVSVNGTPSKENFTSTLEQTITALESGATVLTDSEAYLATSTYNKGEQQLAKVLLDRGYKRSIAKGDVNTAIWTKDTIVSGKDHVSKSDKVIVGDIFNNLENGVIIVTTNLGGVHGAGLAGQAKGKGLLKQHENREFSESPLDKNVITIAVKGNEPNTVEGQYKNYSENRFAEKVVGKNIDLLKDEMRKLYKYAKQESDTKFYIPLVGMGFGEGDPKVIVPIIAEMLKLDNVQLVIPTTDTLSKAANGVKARVDDTINHLEGTMDMLYKELGVTTDNVQGTPVTEYGDQIGDNEVTPEEAELLETDGIEVTLDQVTSGGKSLATPKAEDGIIAYKGKVTLAEEIESIGCK